MSENRVNIECRTNGFEEAQEKVEALASAYDGFPAQVTIRQCHDCVINIYPSQTIINDAEGEEHETEKWISYLSNGLAFRCSECGSRFDRPWHHCPNCGADMRGEEHESV